MRGEQRWLEPLCLQNAVTVLIAHFLLVGKYDAYALSPVCRTPSHQQMLEAITSDHLFFCLSAQHLPQNDNIARIGYGSDVFIGTRTCILNDQIQKPPQRRSVRCPWSKCRKKKKCRPGDSSPGAA